VHRNPKPLHDASKLDEKKFWVTKVKLPCSRLKVTAPVIYHVSIPLANSLDCTSRMLTSASKERREQKRNIQEAIKWQPLFVRTKKPEQIARKTAQCIIYQFPQSTLLSRTARPIVSNLQFPMSFIIQLFIVSNLENHRNGIHIWTHAYIGLMKTYIKIWEPREHCCCWFCGFTFIIFNAIVFKKSHPCKNSNTS